MDLRRPWRTMAIVCMILAVVLAFGAPGLAKAQACAAAKAYEPLPSLSRHELDWRVLAARSSVFAPSPGLIGEGSRCPGAPLTALGEVLRRVVAAGGAVILGEVHDNPHHHHVRAFLLAEAMPAAGRGPGLVFEHIRTDQQPALTTGRAAALAAPPPRDPEVVFKALAWETTGWPDKALFAPLFARALDLGLPLRAGHPDREGLRAVARGGLSAMSETERRRLHLDDPLSPALEAATLDELEASHCGLVPKAAFATMAAAQHYRDAHMAAAVVETRGSEGAAVLLTGNGHVRVDRGVPAYLARLRPELPVLAVTLVETDVARPDPQAYVPRDPAGAPAADVVLLTPRIARADPCIEMRERFGKRKSG